MHSTHRPGNTVWLVLFLAVAACDDDAKRWSEQALNPSGVEEDGTTVPDGERGAKDHPGFVCTRIRVNNPRAPERLPASLCFGLASNATSECAYWADDDVSACITAAGDPAYLVDWYNGEVVDEDGRWLADIWRVKPGAYRIEYRDGRGGVCFANRGSVQLCLERRS